MLLISLMLYPIILRKKKEEKGEFDKKIFHHFVMSFCIRFYVFLIDCKCIYMY
jgi:hypothetical protein